MSMVSLALCGSEGRHYAICKGKESSLGIMSITRTRRTP